MIRILVVDDEALVRSGFALILNAAEGMEVVAAVGGGQALAAAVEHRPDLVLVDVRMPDVDGLTVVGRLRELPEPPVVAMLTTFDGDEYVAAALSAGARGYLLKDTDPEELAPLVRRLVAGGVVLAPRVADVVVRGYLGLHRDRGAAAAVLARLSPREYDTLVLLAQGLSNADVARCLLLSPATVKDHVGAILSKLGVGNRVQAALWAQRAGLLERAAS